MSLEVLESLSDLKYIDNHGQGDDYAVVKVLVQFHTVKKTRYGETLTKRGAPKEVFQYFNHATYETKYTRAFEGPQEEYEVLEELFNKLNKVEVTV